MISINCHDVSGWDCVYVASSESADDIRQQLIDHFLAEHGDRMEEIGEKEQDKISEKIEELLVEAA